MYHENKVYNKLKVHTLGNDKMRNPKNVGGYNVSMGLKSTEFQQPTN